MGRMDGRKDDWMKWKAEKREVRKDGMSWRGKDGEITTGNCHPFLFTSVH